ncbi:TonB-dependent receptor [Urechidicola sp. KH5]
MFFAQENQRQILMKLHSLFILFFVLVCGTAFSQEKGIITGKVLDAEMNNQTLPFANVFIKDTQIGNTTDFDGVYTFSVAPGTYTLVFSFIGYETVEIEGIVVTSDETTEVPDTTLGASEGVALDEVEIVATTKKQSVQALLTEQKNATEVTTSIGADELAQKSVSDAAGAVSKVAGVSQEEGSNNVYVRGLGDRYLNTTFNGLTLPSNSIDKKNIDLNLFTTDIIENISISKSYSPKFYGDFSAGNVNISSKEYTGDGFFDLNVGTSVNSNAAGKDFVKSEGTGSWGYYNRYDHNPFAVVVTHGVDPASAGLPIGYSIAGSAGTSFNFENDSRLSLFISGSFGTEYEFYEGSEIDFGTTINKSFPNVDRYKFSTNTTLLGAAIYRFNENHKLKYNSMFINSSGDEVGYYGTKGDGYNRESRSLVDTERGFYQMNVQFNQELVFVNQLIGEHSLNDKIELDWAMGYNNLYSHEPDRKRISIEDYFYHLDNDPNTHPVLFTNISFDNQRYFQEMEDQEFNSRAQINYEFSENMKMLVGYNGRTKEREFENIRYGYKNIDESLIVNPDNLNSIFNTQNILDSLIQTDVFRPIAPGNGSGSTNRPGLPENTYTGNLDAHGGFVSFEYTPNEKWLIVPGFRAESFQQEISYDVINLVNNPASLKVTEAFYLPSLNIRYSLTEDSNLRFSGSRTVSTPEFKEMAPYVYEGVTQRVGGNPDLLGHQDGLNYTNVKDVSFSDILNFDVKYEWFMGQGQMFSLAGFAKQIKDPVNLVVANDATGTQRYFRTGEKAMVFGVELEARKHILYNSEEMPMLTGGLNATYMHTEQDLYSTISGSYSTSFSKSKEELQGASPFILNADVNFKTTFGENINSNFNLIANYFDDRIFALGSGQLANMVEQGFASLDFVWRNTLGEDQNFEINLSAKNLLNPNIQITRESTQGETILLSSYKRGVDMGVSFKYKF